MQIDFKKIFNWALVMAIVISCFGPASPSAAVNNEVLINSYDGSNGTVMYQLEVTDDLFFELYSYSAAGIVSVRGRGVGELIGKGIFTRDTKEICRMPKIDADTYKKAVEIIAKSKTPVNWKKEGCASQPTDASIRNDMIDMLQKTSVAYAKANKVTQQRMVDEAVAQYKREHPLAALSNYCKAVMNLNSEIVAAAKVFATETCDTCSNGKKDPKTGSCSCPGGTTKTVKNGQTSCECSSGKVFDLKKNSCQSCPSGTISKDNKCQTCPAGTVNKNNSCQACPTGMTAKDNSCQCPSGKFLVTGSNSCQSCPSGTISNNNACQTCPDDTTVENNQCKCPAGLALNSVTQKCEPCGANQILTNGKCECSSAGMKMDTFGECVNNCEPDVEKTVENRCESNCQPGALLNVVTRNCDSTCSDGYTNNGKGACICSGVYDPTIAACADKCPANLARSVQSSGLVVCTECPPGTYPFNGECKTGDAYCDINATCPGELIMLISKVVKRPVWCSNKRPKNAGCAEQIDYCYRRLGASQAGRCTSAGSDSAGNGYCTTPVDSICDLPPES